jgi:hypothetical protein
MIAASFFVEFHGARFHINFWTIEHLQVMSCLIALLLNKKAVGDQFFPNKNFSKKTHNRRLVHLLAVGIENDILQPCDGGV